MSYQNASQPVARFVANWARTDISFGMTKALVQASLLNNRINVADLQDAPGKLRTFKLTYYPIQCDAEGSCSDNICNSGERIEPAQQYFELTRCTASKVFELAVDDIRLIDDDGMSFSQHAQAQFASTMVAMRKVLDQQLLAIMIANTGLLPDGNPTMQLNLTDINGAPNPIGFATIDKIFADGYYNNPYIVGGYQVDMYNRLQPLAGQAANGLNLGAVPFHNLFYDPLLNPAYGDGKQHILAFDPQVIKFITWNKNAGMFATDLTGLGDFTTLFRRGMQSSIHGTLVDPVYPIMWDIDIHYDDCQEVWTYRIRLYWDIFFLPPDVCNLQGVNGIFGFTTCDPVILPCPTGTPYPPAPAPRVYAWTPSVTYPMTVATLKLGRVETRPNKNVTNLDDLVAVMNDSGSGITYVKNGTAVNYTGNTAIQGTINDTIGIMFA